MLHRFGPTKAVRDRHASVLVAAMCLLVARPASPTVLLPADLADLIAESRAIVHARVIDVRSHLTNGQRDIETLVTVEIAEYFKGDLGPTLTFRVPVGEVGAFRRIVVGAPEFRAGEEVVLFLNSQGPTIPHVLGLSQGVFRVVHDARAGVKMVTPPALVTRTESGETQRVVRGEAGRVPMPLQTFGGEIRRIKAEQERTGRRR
jgi:hypothetical protein